MVCEVREDLPLLRLFCFDRSVVLLGRAPWILSVDLLCRVRTVYSCTSLSLWEPEFVLDVSINCTRSMCMTGLIRIDIGFPSPLP